MAEAPKKRIVKKVDGGHGHHGGAWKVAYADFVTAMMALFMVMWLLASTDAQSRKEISNYFRSGILKEGDLAMNSAAQATPAIIEAAPVPPPKNDETVDQTAVDMRNELAKLAHADPDLEQVIRNVTVKITNEGILLEAVDEDGLLFDTASSKLKEPLEKFLQKLAPTLDATGAPIEINGHTDARPFAAGSKVTNWDLSYQRASAARELITSKGFPDARIQGVYAHGASQLYVPADPLSSKNRRLSILVKIAKPAAPKTVDAKTGEASLHDAAGGKPSEPAAAVEPAAAKADDAAAGAKAADSAKPVTK
jgi:chemotaxis protein MotB